MTSKRVGRHTKAELNATAITAQAGDRDALDRLFAMMRPYLVSMLRKIDQTRYTRDERDELDQAAAVGVMEALKRFDPEAGTKFSTWAYPWVKGELSEWLARNTGGISMPRAAFHYAAHIEEAWYEAGSTRSPHEATDEELASLAIEVVRNGDPTTLSVPYAGDIFRARKSTFEIPDNHETPSVETAVFGEEGETGFKRRGVTAAQEKVTLAFIDSLAGLETEAWWDAAEQFIEERRLPTDVATLIEVARLYHGRTPLA